VGGVDNHAKGADSIADLVDRRAESSKTGGKIRTEVQVLTGCCPNAFLQRFDARDPSLRSGRHLKALFLVVILNEVKNLDFAF
jgi:hypothetical protein